MQVGDFVKIVSDPNIPAIMKPSEFGPVFTYPDDAFVYGRVARKVVYDVVIECEDGSVIEGDMDDLALFRGLRVV